MAIQGQNGVTRSQGGLPIGNGVSLNSGLQYVTSIENLDDHCENETLKARKPYTITKQRERWTDKEHGNFLEALKLYGRAWPRIEEHVGTKTAVQIRSHAQKVFTKILRGSNGNNTTLVESIEIPPPRPKRKPSHPYPRKLVEILITEQPLRSQMFQSPKSSDFCQENKIPKSELSVIVSETFGSSDSDTPTGSFSPVSSYSGIITSSFPPVELKTSCEEDKSPPLDGLNGGTPYNKQPLVELAHFSKDNVCSKDDAREESSVCTFKLFGTTLLVTDTCKHSSPTLETIKPIPAMYLMQLQSGCSEIATIVPWWTLSHKEPAEGKYPYANLGECEDKEVQKEGSWAGSSSSSVHDGENNERSDDQTKSQVHYLVDHTTPSEVSAISEFRVRSKTCGKGFVPYKRCVAKRENQCSTVTDEKREEQ